MLRLLLCLAQVAGPVLPADSVYSSPALRDLVARAAEENRRPPAEFRSYTSHIESELSLMLRDTLGREHTAEVEQFASNAAWDRHGRYDLHVVGYRSQSVGVPYSTLSIVRGWTVPSLYGNRLSLGAYFTRRRSTDTLRAVHPFATDRDSFYRFTGGDTVTVLRIGARRIPITRIHVHPNIHGETKLGAFDGEIDLDADRAQIVRMRGQFVTLGGQDGAGERIIRALTGLVAVAYIEFVNAEVNGKYWLPSFQRTEFQASFPVFGQTRPIFRLVSNIENVVVRDSAGASADSSFTPRVVITWAPRDSVDRFTEWRRGIGEQSGAVHSDDFRDMAPDAWRLDGPPRLTMFPNSTSRTIRFNRVEGLFTGLAPSVDFRNVAPGLTVGAHAGWAWTEKTVRGGASATYARGLTTFGLRAERLLAPTNDFALPLSEDPGFGAFLSSIDDFDYIDRRTAIASLTRVVGAVDVALVTVQAGVADDRAEHARLTHGPLANGDFRLNRGSADGRYAIGSVDVEVHPNVTGDFVQPGLGARLHVEAGSGDLTWQRTELALSARKYFGPISLAAHADGGMVFGRNLPPQRLFEVGGNETLTGYDYKQFAGDRAALLRTFASYRFNVWRRPVRLVRNFFIPGLSPGLAASAQAGWTEISSAHAATAVRQLGAVDGVPVSEATGGMRATVGGGLTLFSDLVHVGVARPVDRPAHWKFVAGFGAAF